MNRRALIGLAAVALSLSAAVPAIGSVDRASHDTSRTRPTRESILVRFDPSATRFIPMGSRWVDERWTEVPVPPGQTARGLMRSLAAKPGVMAVQENFLYVPAGTVINDPLYPDQWHMATVGLPAALAISSGAGVRIAVVDSGAEQGPDGFCKPFVDEYDAVNNTAGAGSAFDVIGHGTFVAGVAAQCTGNGVGGAGMAPSASVMPIAVFADDGFATSAWIARGIDWARTHGARIINLSLGSNNCTTSDPALADAIRAATAQGILVVGASGNDGGPVCFPASMPEVIAVGAVDRSRTRASFSNQGTGLDLTAPGVDILQEDISGGYSLGDGTSFAAPHVSGALALLLATGKNAADAALLIRCTAQDRGPAGFDNAHGHGLLDAAAAVAGTWRPGCPRSYVSLVDVGGRWWVGLPEPNGFSQLADFYFGNPGDVPFMGDWNCDGIATPGLYRQTDGFVYLRNSNTQGIADVRFFFGNPGDVPVAGDFNGNGCDTVSIYRPSEGRFYVINKLGSNEGGLGAAEYSFYFGVPGDKPFVGDFNGDGIDTVGLHRESSGFVYFRNSNTQGPGEFQFFWGNPGDAVFAADWNGDGRDTVGLFRPANNTLYFRNSNTAGNADFAFGAAPGNPAGGYRAASGSN